MRAFLSWYSITEGYVKTVSLLDPTVAAPVGGGEFNVIYW